MWYTGPPLANSGVEQRGFVAWVGSYEQKQVALLDASDAGVQQVVGAKVSADGGIRKATGLWRAANLGHSWFKLRIDTHSPCSCHREHLLSAEVFWTESVEEVFEGDESLRVDHASCYGCYLTAPHALQLHINTYAGRIQYNNRQTAQSGSAVKLSYLTHTHLSRTNTLPRNTYCPSNTSESILPGGWYQLSWTIFHHRQGQPLPLQTIVCKPGDRRGLLQSDYQRNQEKLAVSLTRVVVCVRYLVLSEIHSSLTSSFNLGITLITSPPLVLTTMLLPTASSTSIDSVFLQT